MAEKINKGIFITFEGPEGSGKSTQSRRMQEELTSDGYEAVHTAEPGDTSLGKRIRDILLEKDEIALGQMAELFLFEADRAQHVEDVIVPAIEAGKIVLCDRFNTATFAYQGYGLGMDMEFIKRVDEAARGGIVPDLTLLLDLDVAKGLSRANAGRAADRMEKRGLEFHEKVRKGYLDLAKAEPGRIKVIEVKDDIDATYELVKSEIYAFIKGHKGTE